MDIVEAVLLLIAACIGFAVLARRLRLPYAVILVLGGMALAFVPGLPEVRLDPELALAFFLPPLLQASAFRTDWRGFRRDLRPILLLAVGGVLFTAALHRGRGEAHGAGTALGGGGGARGHRRAARRGGGGRRAATGAPAAPGDDGAGRREPHQRRHGAGALSLRGRGGGGGRAVALGRRAQLPPRGRRRRRRSAWRRAGPRSGSWRGSRTRFWKRRSASSSATRAILAAEALHLSGVIAVVSTGIVLGQTQYRFAAGDAARGAAGLALPRIHSQQPGLHPDRPAAQRHPRPAGRPNPRGRSPASRPSFPRR